MAQFYNQADDEPTAERPSWSTLGHPRQHADTEVMPPYRDGGVVAPPPQPRPAWASLRDGERAVHVSWMRAARSRPQFGSIFWPVFCAILAAVLVCVAVFFLLASLLVSGLLNNNDSTSNAAGRPVTSAATR